MQKLSQKSLLLLFMLLALAACGRDHERVTDPSPFHGIHGMAFDAEGRLLAGSVLGRAIYEVDIESGDSDIFIGPPEGMADDIALAPDGTIAWTAFLEGKIYAQDPDGTIRMLAEGLAGINSIAFAPDGRLFASQVFEGDALYEIDPQGKSKPRLILKDMGGFNGFEVGPNDRIYGPLWFKGQVASINPNTGDLRVEAEGFAIPAAVNFDPQNKNHLYVVDTKKGEVIRVNLKTQDKKVVSRVKPSIDNLAFSPDGRLFISNMADNAIIEINKDTGDAKTITSGPLSTAADIAFGPERDTLYIADLFSLRTLDTQTGSLGEIARMFGNTLDYPLNIWVGKDRVVTTGWSAGALQIIEKKSGKSLALIHGLITPHDALMLSRNLIVLSEYANGRLLTLSGKDWKERRVFIDGLEGPASLLRRGRTVYVSEAKAGRITTVNIDNGGKSTYASGLSRPEGMDFMPDGRIIVAEVGKKQLTAVSQTGEKEVIASNLPIGLEGPAGSPVDTYALTGVAVGKDGTIYFSSDIDAAIYKAR